MNVHKKIILTLTLLTLPLIHGCSHENREVPNKASTQVNPNAIDKEKISKIEAEIYTELKSINGAFYRATLGGATTDDMISIYDKVNLLSVKLVGEDNKYKIKLFYDELSIKKDFVMENFTDPLYNTAYSIAEKYKIENSKVKIYFDGKLVDDIMEKKYKK